jgi:hypothetical protein
MQSAPQPYELVLLDSNLGSMDGAQMMQLLKQHNPAGHFVLVGDSIDENARAAAYRSGADLFLERPTTPEAFDQAVEAIAELLKPAPAADPEESDADGRVVAIADIIQMRCLSGDSVLLSVRSQFQGGEIFIYHGEVFHAQYPGKSGEAAFRDMVSWDGGLVKIKATKLASIPPRTIDASYRQLLSTLDPDNPRPFEQPGGELYMVQGELPPPAPNLSVVNEAPPLEETPPPAFPDLRPKRRGATPLPRVNSHWMVNLSGDLLEGSQVADVERCAFITSFIYRKMADVAVALEVDYFDQMTLLGPHLQQVLVADNLGVRHAVFDAPWTTEEMRVQYVKWCREQSF